MIREHVSAAGSLRDMLVEEPHTTRQRREDNIKMELGDIDLEKMNWVELPLDEMQYSGPLSISRRSSLNCSMSPHCSRQDAPVNLLLVFQEHSCPEFPRATCQHIRMGYCHTPRVAPCRHLDTPAVGCHEPGKCTAQGS
jgi:hypothetical protein